MNEELYILSVLTSNEKIQENDTDNGRPGLVGFRKNKHKQQPVCKHTVIGIWNNIEWMEKERKDVRLKHKGI